MIATPITPALAEAIEERRLQALRRRIVSARRHAPVAFRVAGVNSHPKGCRAAVESGSRVVTLSREPSNIFDKTAIAVRVGGEKVGFVPKADIARVRQRMSLETLPVLRSIGTFSKGFFVRVGV